MQITVHSNIGRRRSSNQDYADFFENDFEQNLFVLCDGVGGSQAGDVASQMTTQGLGEQFKQLTEPLDEETVSEWMKEAIEKVNWSVYQYSTENEQYQGMSTTLVMAIIIEDTIFIAHVGDSRAYVYQDNKLYQITQDHSLVNELIRSGQITKEEGEVHPQRNVVTQAIGGHTSVSSEINQVEINQTSILLLCSDGLSNMLTVDEMERILSQPTETDQLGNQLIEAANEAGGADNITVIIVRRQPSEIVGGAEAW